jgi:arsenate reductase
MKTVLFACIHNAGRSQMAAAFLLGIRRPDEGTRDLRRHRTGPARTPEVVATMRELGIDVSNAQPRLLTDDLARSAEMLITMGCGEACPHVLGLRREDWPLEDPKGRDADAVRRIRDDVRERVRALVEREGVARR